MTRDYYVARDYDGSLNLYEQKPTRSDGVWLTEGKYYPIDSALLPELTNRDRPRRLKMEMSNTYHDYKSRAYKIKRLEMAGYKVFEREKTIILERRERYCFKGSLSGAIRFVFGY